MSENNIISVAVHDLRKVNETFEVIVGNSGLKVSDTVQRLVDQLHTLYGRRTSKSHGQFSEDEVNYPTQAHLKNYLGNRPHDFSVLTEEMMKTLQSKAKGTAATGGHVFFAHFDRDARHYLMVAIVNDRLSAALTKQHDVHEVTHLDVDGFRFAGRINITAWTNEEERYIGFLKGKGDVAEYFQEFLGCALSVQERADTKALVDALKDFADKQNYTIEDKGAFLAKAKEICARAASKREELSFEALTNELVPDDPVALRDHLADPDRRLNDGFIPNRAMLNYLVRFKARTSHWTIDFDRDALVSGEVKFDPAKGTLTLSNVPDDLKGRLRTELQDG